MGRIQRYLQKSDIDTGGCQTEIQTEVSERNGQKDRDKSDRGMEKVRQICLSVLYFICIYIYVLFLFL